MTAERKDDEIEYLQVVVDADNLRTMDIDGESIIAFNQEDIEAIGPAPIEALAGADSDATVSRFDSYNAATDPEWKRKAILDALAAPPVCDQTRKNLRDTLSD